MPLGRQRLTGARMVLADGIPTWLQVAHNIAPVKPMYPLGDAPVFWLLAFENATSIWWPAALGQYSRHRPVYPAVPESPLSIPPIGYHTQSLRLVVPFARLVLPNETDVLTDR
jgi:hypothetical protein